MTDSHPLGRYLDRHGIPKKDFAARLGISAPFLSLILSGARRVSLALSLKIETETDGEVTGEECAAFAARAAEPAE